MACYARSLLKALTSLDCVNVVLTDMLSCKSYAGQHLTLYNEFGEVCGSCLSKPG